MSFSNFVKQEYICSRIHSSKLILLVELILQILVGLCMAFDIIFFDAHSIYQKQYCENIGRGALDIKYQQENLKINGNTTCRKM